MDSYGEIKIKDFGKEITEISLSSFIAAFIEGVSSATIDKVVSSGFDTLDKIKTANIKDLCIQAEIMESVAIIIKYGVHEHEKEMNEFIQSGKIKLIMPFVNNASLKGISFCFTGPLEIMKRNIAKEKVRMLGGIATNAVNRDLTFLVTNDTDSGSSKNEGAKEYGITTISENEFYDILQNPGKANEYKERRYKNVNEADNKTAIIISLDDAGKAETIDRLPQKTVFAGNKCILSKYKGKGIDLKAIQNERCTLRFIQENIKKNQIDCLHNCYVSIASLYYKYRGIDTELLSESLKYYLLDLELLPKYKDFKIKQYNKTYKEFGSSMGEEYLHKEIEKIQNEPTYGADETFKRLIIIYEKQELYENALEICDKAIKFGENNLYYEKKMENLKLKLSDRQQSAEIMDINRIKPVWVHCDGD
jgi:tetratricopeptide (TPR) repeat protein